MQIATPTHRVFVMSARIDLLTGGRTLDLGDWPNTRLEAKPRDADPVDLATGAEMIEFRFRITVSGLRIHGDDALTPDGSPAVAPEIAARFEERRDFYERLLSDAAHEAARRRLGERGWVVLDTQARLGSVEWIVDLGMPVSAVVAAAGVFSAVAGYSAFRSGVIAIFTDLTDTLPNLTRRLGRYLLSLDEDPSAILPAETDAPKTEEDASEAAALAPRLDALNAGLDRLETQIAALSDVLSKLDGQRPGEEP